MRELLFIPGRFCLAQEPSITIDGISVAVSCLARNPGIILDVRLDFKKHMGSQDADLPVVSQKEDLSVSASSTQLFYQATVLFVLVTPFSLAYRRAIRTLRIIQKAVAHLIFKLAKCSHTAPMPRSLHWLLIATGIRHKSLTLAYAAANRTCPTYLQHLTQLDVPTRGLCAATSGHLAIPGQSKKGPRTPTPCSPSTLPRDGLTSLFNHAPLHPHSL